MGAGSDMTGVGGNGTDHLVPCRALACACQAGDNCLNTQYLSDSDSGEDSDDD